jgi:hypothetical protein
MNTNVPEKGKFTKNTFGKYKGEHFKTHFIHHTENVVIYCAILDHSNWLMGRQSKSEARLLGHVRKEEEEKQ